MHVLNVMLAKELGGTEQAFADYLRALSLRRCKCTSLISTGAKIQEYIPKDVNYLSITQFGIWDFFAVLKIKNILRKIKPDVIIIHGNRSVRLCSRATKDIPIISVTHNYNIKKLLIADHIFATTKLLLNHCVKAGYNLENITVIPNMINISGFKFIKPKFHAQPIIGVMGRFVHKKGFHIFIDAVKILKDQGIDFKVIIAGDGEEKNALQMQAKKLGLLNIVNFIGWVRNKSEFYSAIDIFCLPSIHEPFGIVLLEAFLYSKPVVAIRSEGPSEIGTDNNNILFAEKNNAEDLAKKIAILLNDKNFAADIAKVGFKEVQNYSIEKVSEKIIHALEKVVRKT